MTSRPAGGEYDPFFASYVALVPEDDVLEALERQVAEVARVASRIDPARENFRYAPDKWSIREVFSHLIDAERIFGFRAFCISRGDQSPLPGFEEKDYVAESDANARPLSDLVRELAEVRETNLAFLRRLDEHRMQRTGTANKHLISVRALAYIMTGHIRHHLTVLRQRYGVTAES